MDYLKAVLDYMGQSDTLCVRRDCSSSPKWTSTTQANRPTTKPSSTGQPHPTNPWSNHTHPIFWPNTTSHQPPDVPSTTIPVNTSTARITKTTPGHDGVTSQSSPSSSSELSLEYKTTSEGVWSITDKDFTAAPSPSINSSTVLDWHPPQTSAAQTLSNSEAISDVSLYSNSSAISHHSWRTLQTSPMDEDLTSLLTQYDVTDIVQTTEKRTVEAGMVWWLILYGVIVIIGILSNMFAMLSILLIKKLRTCQNMFVLNLCVADIFLGINALFTFIRKVNPDISIQEDMTECYVLGFFTFIPPLAVVLSMTVIARNRYQVIVQMNNNQVFKKKVAVKLLLVWVISVVISLPILSGVITVKTYLFCTCCFYFSENLIYGLTVTICVAVVPNLVIIYSYIRIFIVIRKSRKRVENHKSNTQLAYNKKGDIRLAIQFIILFAVFNICYLPTMIIFWTISDPDDNITTPLIAFIMNLFACNLIANPMIYFIMNKMAMAELRSCCKADEVTVDGLPDQPIPAVTPKHKLTVFGGTSPNRISPEGDDGRPKAKVSLWSQGKPKVKGKGTEQVRSCSLKDTGKTNRGRTSFSSEDIWSDVSHLSVPTESNKDTTARPDNLQVIETEL